MASTTERGYGAAHQRERKRWAAMLPQSCTRCGGEVNAQTPWQLDHTEDRTGYLGVAHASCNSRAGQAKGQRRIRSALPWLKSSRSW